MVEPTKLILIVYLLIKTGLSFSQNKISGKIIDESKNNDFPYFEKLNDLRFLSMNPNIIRFSEALKYNLYYNKKAYIESNGDVYCAPTINEKYGHIFNENILNIINVPRFQRYWGITKDDISVCMDCEFRYICTDCRIFKKDNNDIYSKPEKCTYDPYKNTWA